MRSGAASAAPLLFLSECAHSNKKGSDEQPFFLAPRSCPNRGAPTFSMARNPLFNSRICVHFRLDKQEPPCIDLFSIQGGVYGSTSGSKNVIRPEFLLIVAKGNGQDCSVRLKPIPQTDSMCPFFPSSPELFCGFLIGSSATLLYSPGQSGLPVLHPDHGRGQIHPRIPRRHASGFICVTGENPSCTVLRSPVRRY